MYWWMPSNSWVFWLLYQVLHSIFLANAEGCKDMDFKVTLEGKTLANHVFKTVPATNDGHCQSLCFLDDRCISYSYGTSAKGEGSMCELSDSDHFMHPEDLVDRPGVIYRSAQNTCNCPKNSTCRYNFADNTHRCECKTGFTGDQCQTEITPCSPNPCMNGAACINIGDQFNCTCKPGFTGKVCNTAIDYCDPSPCLNGGSCNGDAAGYSCQCPDGVIGKNCQTRYYSGTGTVSWGEADTKCKALGTNLPSIHSAEQNEIVKQLREKVKLWTWIGLHRNEDGRFVWSDSSPVDYENWKPVQDHPLTGCVYIDDLGMWCEYPCSWGNGNGCILQ